MTESCVWFFKGSTQYYHNVYSFDHAVKVIEYLSSKFGATNVGYEHFEDGVWIEWEDDYGLNIHAHTSCVQTV